MKHRVFIALGSNLGDRSQHLEQAIMSINSGIGQVVKQSSVYETAAWGLEDQQAYLNQCIEIETSLDPLPLLLSLQHLETYLGRVRTIKWGPRLIDLDILLYDQEEISLPELKIPHPFLAERRFVLEPLNEIAASTIVPKWALSVSELLNKCPDPLHVGLYSPSETADYEKAGVQKQQETDERSGQ